MKRRSGRSPDAENDITPRNASRRLAVVVSAGLMVLASIALPWQVDVESVLHEQVQAIASSQAAGAHEPDAEMRRWGAGAEREPVDAGGSSHSARHDHRPEHSESHDHGAECFWCVSLVGTLPDPTLARQRGAAGHSGSCASVGLVAERPLMLGASPRAPPTLDALPA